jgi:hypothetical protein
MIMSDLANIRKRLEEYPGNKVMLRDPIRVNVTEHMPAFICWGAGASDQGIYLMDADQQWHGPLKTHQDNADALIAGLCNRLGLTEIIS